MLTRPIIQTNRLYDNIFAPNILKIIKAKMKIMDNTLKNIYLNFKNGK